MTFRIWIAVVAMAVQATTASAAGASTEADWLKRPTDEQLLQVLPRGAMSGVDRGKAMIGCTVTVQGALRGCKVLSESPPGKGFGDAALMLTPYFQLRPATRDGKLVEGTVQIPINWKGDLGLIAPRAEAPTGSFLKPSPNSQRMVGRLPWQEAPSLAEVLAAYPEKARAAKAGGRVVLDCVLSRTGRLVDCRTTTETTKGYGFAGAARALSAKFVAPTMTGQGESLAGVHTQVMFNFDPQSIDPTTQVIGRPDWTALPQPQDFTSAIPPKAQQAGILQARVVMTCVVGPGGSLRDCAVQSEDPPGYGFGAAAVTLTGKFRLNPWTAEGLPTIGGAVRVPLRYDLKQAPDPAPPRP